MNGKLIIGKVKSSRLPLSYFVIVVDLFG